MIIDTQILDELTAKAKESPRLRVAMDLRNSPVDPATGQKRMTECITKCQPYLKITDIQINGTPFNSSSLSHGQEVLDVLIKGTTQEPMRCGVRLIIKGLGGTPYAGFVDGHYVIDLKLHEPYSQDFFLAPDCQNLRIEGFYEPFSRSLVLPNEGFIGLESTLIQEEK